MRWMVRTIKGLLMALLVFCCGVVMTAPVEAAGLPPGVIAVDSAASGANDGSSWEHAYNFLQDGLADAMQDPTIEQIWVAAAIYYPDECDTCGPNGTDLRSDSFELVDAVKLYGGFLNGDVFEDRDPENNITILSGDIDQNDGPAQFEDYDNNSYHVLRADDVGPTTVLNGFEVRAGNANGLVPNNGAGAMWIADASPVVVRCRFVENLGGGVGAIYWPGGLMQGNPAVAVPAFMVNCEFIDNQATGAAHRRGGGLHIDNLANVTLVNCTFIRNSAKRGGGLFLAGVCEVTLINCTVSENTATVVAGGIYGLAALTIHNSIL